MTKFGARTISFHCEFAHSYQGVGSVAANRNYSRHISFPTRPTTDPGFVCRSAIPTAYPRWSELGVMRTHRGRTTGTGVCFAVKHNGTIKSSGNVKTLKTQGLTISLWGLIHSEVSFWLRADSILTVAPPLSLGQIVPSELLSFICMFPRLNTWSCHGWDSKSSP